MDGSEERRRRLLIFFNRYVEGVGRTKELTARDAALLLAIQYGEEHPDCMLNQTQIASLLGVRKGRVTEKLKPKGKLSANGLCEPLSDQERGKLGIQDSRSNYFRLTRKGVRALDGHARMNFDLPSKMAQELPRMTEYQIVTRCVNELLERELARKFEEARRT